MRTSNYQLDLLAQNQAMKEFTINHALDKIDWLINRSAIDFINELPEEKSEGDMYIIYYSEGELREDNNKLAIYIGERWQLLTPSAGTILYVQKQRSFYIMFEQSWEKV